MNGRRALRTSILLLLLGSVRASAAETLCVNSGGTGGCLGSVQAAVDAAAAGATVAVAAGTFLENVVVPIGKRLTIEGAGAETTILDGAAAGAALTIDGPNPGVTVANLTLTNAIDPGALWVGQKAKATVRGCSIRDNATVGIHVRQRARVVISDSAITGNTWAIAAPFGDQRAKSRIDLVSSVVSGNVNLVPFAATIDVDKVKLRIVDTTVSGNTAAAAIQTDILFMTGSTVSNNTGSGIGAGGVFGPPRISNSTISGNPGTGVGLGTRGQLDHVTIAGNGVGLSTGIYVKISSVLIADNAIDCDSVPELRVVRGALVENPAGCNLVAVGGAPILTGDPGLLPLQDNGGSTETQALSPGSIAAGALTQRSACHTPDQRGVPRTAPCDLGAYELP